MMDIDYSLLPTRMQESAQLYVHIVRLGRRIKKMMKEDYELVGKDFWRGALLAFALSMMIVAAVWFLFTYFTIWF